MLYARIARFDVMNTVSLFEKKFRELNKGSDALACMADPATPTPTSILLLVYILVAWRPELHASQSMM